MSSRPPRIDGQLMKRMRNACAWLLLPAYVLFGSLAGVQALIGRHAPRRPHRQLGEQVDLRRQPSGLVSISP